MKLVELINYKKSGRVELRVIDDKTGVLSTATITIGEFSRLIAHPSKPSQAEA